MSGIAGTSLAQAALAPALAPAAPSSIALPLLAQVQQIPEQEITRLLAPFGIGAAVDVRA
jgi:hypothetical protein